MVRRRQEGRVSSFKAPPRPGAEPRFDRSFDEFFRDEYRSFVKAVMFAGASLDDAEDAVSAAMIEAYLSWPLLANPVAWVRTAAVHHFINSAQRNRRRPILEVQAARRDRVDVAATQPGEEPDERSQVLMALRGLPSAQRSVMALALDGHEPAEIAEMLGVQPANVRSNLRHARERLRHSLKDFGDEKAGSSTSRRGS